MDFLLNEDATSDAKSSLYPLGYGGIGNYPPAAILPKSADAIYYMTLDTRAFKHKWHEPDPWPIDHIASPDAVVPHRGHGMPGEENVIPPKPSNMPGEDEIVPHKEPPNIFGRIVPFSSWVTLVKKPETLEPDKVPSQVLHRWD